MNVTTYTGPFEEPQPHCRFHPSLLLSLSLDRQAADFCDQFGPPDRISSTDSLLVFDYDEFARHEHSCSLVFDASGQRALCITRRFAFPQDLSEMFPSGQTTSLESRGPGARFRELDPQRVLVGIGQYQLVLVRTAALKRFLPWIPVH